MDAPVSRLAPRRRLTLAFLASLAIHVVIGSTGARLPRAHAAMSAETLTPLIIRIHPPPRRPTPPPAPLPERAVERPRRRALSSAVTRVVAPPALPRRAAASGSRRVASALNARPEADAPSDTGTASAGVGDRVLGPSVLPAVAVSPSSVLPPSPSPSPKPACAEPNRDARTLSAVEPEVPEVAREAGATGTATVRVDLDPDGHVTFAAIAQTSGSAALDTAARAAAMQSRYAPETRDCVPVAGSYLFVATFDQ